jgi:hypothetical protein
MVPILQLYARDALGLKFSDGKDVRQLLWRGVQLAAWVDCWLR